MLYQTAKRIFDLLISSVAIVVLFPVLVIFGIIIYFEDNGPIFYRPIRLGKDSKTFKLWKFRSMVINAPDIRNPDGSTYNSSKDPRITRIGHFIRKTSIDELPQLINVFLGEMSIVGPRPDPTDAVKYYREKDFNRLTVKQGITGWAQINGRNGIEWKRRRDLDLEYVKRRNLKLDFLIIIKTIIVVFKKDNINMSDQ